jgi:pSer/pThr/pTyr-binding forkhead associated (FHA) protein
MPTQPLDDFIAPVQSAQPTMVLQQPTPSFAWLAIVSGSRAGRLYNLDPRGTLVGRDAQNDIVLDDDAVSRQHAKLRVEEGTRKKSDQFYIYDLGTSNGTLVNGRKIANRVALHDGDAIRVGETELIFKSVASQSAAKRPTKKRKRATKAK